MIKNNNRRIVNIRYKVKGLRFDAAVDCDWALHVYGCKDKEVTPVELYCLDHKDWDVRMVFHKEQNDQQGIYDKGLFLHSCVDFGVILKETRKWIKEQGL